MNGKILGVVCGALLLCATSVAQVRIDEPIAMTDGAQLDATIMKPSGVPPPGGFPGIVIVHGLGGSKDDMLPVSYLLLSRGYASLAYSVRGQGRSGGFSSLLGRRERRDLREVIRHFRSIADVDSEHIGVTGASQGGIHSWMAAVDRMPGVRAVAPLLATPNFARALVPNGCMRYGLAYEMSLGSVRYDADRDRVKGFIIADQYDSVLAYINERDLADSIDNIEIPVFQQLGWADYLFPVNGGIDAAARLASRNIPVRSYYGTNSHGEQVNSEEASFQLEQTLQWFDRWLKGIPLQQDSLPMVTYADDRPDWPHHTTTLWPPALHQTVRLYLTAGGLSTAPPTSEGLFPFTLAYDTTYLPEMAWTDYYAGPRFMSAFLSSPSRLVSEPLQDSVEITGMPSGLLHVWSDAPKFQSHVHLFDVSGSGWTLMSRASSGIRENESGQLHDIPFAGTALSHILPAGHRIGIEITSLDMLRWDRANTIPYFLTSHSEALSSAQASSYVDLPVVGSLSLVAVREVAEHPGPEFRLEQNYPNPFNPTTVVSSQLPVASWVELAVYDLLGREVAVLFNGWRAAGTYHDTFSADGLGSSSGGGETGLSSGVYFCRLTAGPFVVTRRMLLLR